MSGGIHEDVVESYVNYDAHEVQLVDDEPEHVKQPVWHLSQYGKPAVVWAK